MSTTTFKRSPAAKFLRFSSIMIRQMFSNWEYIYFLLLGTIIGPLWVGIYHPFWILFFAVYSFLIGVITIGLVVGPVDRAFETLGFDFSKGYGLPLWIVEGKHPLKSEIIRINAAGYSAKDFEAHLDQLSSRLSQSIKEIRKPSPSHPIIEVVLKRSHVPSTLSFDQIASSEFRPGEFIVGRGDDGLIRLLLSSMVHMLVAGQTGSGKTQFLRQVIATILSYTRYAHVCMIDMKGGIDFGAFRELACFELVTTHNTAMHILNDITSLYEKRKSYLLKVKKSNWNELSQKDLLKAKEFENLPIGPVLVVVDELAELSRKATEKAVNSDLQEQLSTLSRLARFTGIHLILGTQRPDKSTIDMQSKDNLPTRVCFSVPSVAASTLVVNDMTASTLGYHPGRAVFQLKGNTILQTPHLSNEHLDTLMMGLKERLRHSGYARNVSGNIKNQTAEIKPDDKPTPDKDPWK